AVLIGVCRVFRLTRHCRDGHPAVVSRALVLTASGPRLLSLPLALTADFGLRTSSACQGELPHRHARVAAGAPHSWLADMVYRRQAAQKIPSSSTGMNSWLAMAAVLLVACGGGGSGPVTARSDIALICAAGVGEPGNPVPTGTKICNDVTVGDAALRADFTTAPTNDDLVEVYPGSNT